MGILNVLGLICFLVNTKQAVEEYFFHLQDWSNWPFFDWTLQSLFQNYSLSRNNCPREKTLILNLMKDLAVIVRVEHLAAAACFLDMLYNI